jgi:hypothetical protein
MTKHIIIFITTVICILLLRISSYAQWSTSLNFVGVGQAAFLGTNTPYPLRIYTDNENRMHINQNISNVINSQPSIARNGYVGIGRNQTPATIWNSPGPISLLHLNGDEGSVMGTQGYRNWMRNGITITSNSDLMFMGPRRRGADDITDAVFGWADNPAGPGIGPDNMLFVFSTGTGTGTDLDGGGADGREIMRMNANGNIGMGPRFSNAAQPQSQLHINAENTAAAWLQVTNQSNTGQSATDGLRMGVNGTNAYIYNQENAHLIFSTNNTTANLAGERMRLTHIGAAGTPATAAGGSTRLAISINPASPLTAPRSLVHIGENTGGIIPGTDGVRNWMDVGYLATANSDNIYVGLKREGDDRQDAVVAWGDNQTGLVNGSGPDNLRFIFANSQYAPSPGTPESKSDNGQEVARFTPVGQLGVGNFAPASPNAPGTATYVGATLDVDGDARVRTVTRNDALTQILVRDPNDLGRLHWRDANTFAGGGLGNDCGAAPVPLTASREVPLGANSFIFSGQHATGARVAIGTAGCAPNAKLEVAQDAGINQYTVAATNSTPAQNSGMNAAVLGLSDNSSSHCNSSTFGGNFRALSNSDNVGVMGYAMGAYAPVNCEPTSSGGIFIGSGSVNNYGILTSASGGSVNWAAYINGDGYAGSLWTISDSRLKENIRPLENVSRSLMLLNPVSYDFNNENAPTLNVPEGHQFGILAQELGEVFPDLVRNTPVPPKITEGGLGKPTEGLEEVSVVNYNGLIPVLIAAFQEQTRRMEEQDERINQLEQQLNGCCNTPKSMAAPTGAVVQTRLENNGGPALGQNIPNPFESATRIPAYVPQDTRKAEIMFYGNDGRVLQVLPINDRGGISVDVDAATLAAGVYSYTLFVDGKPVDTKRMVKQ